MNWVIYYGSLIIASVFTGGDHNVLFAVIAFYITYMHRWLDQANAWDKQMADKTIKRCPLCTCSQLSALSSTDEHLCTNGKCLNVFEWKLKPGVASVLIKGKVGE